MAKKAAKKAVKKKSKTIRVYYTIPVKLKSEADQLIADLIKNNDIKYQKIVEVLRDGVKEKKTIMSLHWELRTMHGINRRPDSLKEIAALENIPYTE